MGQTAVSHESVQGTYNVIIATENDPPHPKPPKKSMKEYTSSGAKFTEIKFREHRAGAHTLAMISCVH